MNTRERLIAARLLIIKTRHLCKEPTWESNPARKLRGGYTKPSPWWITKKEIRKRRKK